MKPEERLADIKKEIEEIRDPYILEKIKRELELMHRLPNISKEAAIMIDDLLIEVSMKLMDTHLCDPLKLKTMEQPKEQS